MNRPVLIACSVLGLSVALVSAAVPAAAAAPASAPAAQLRIAKFAVANMTCATCPIAVKKAMQGVAGVRSVKIDFGSKIATVAFDAKRTNLATIAAASTNAGYPAKLAI